MLCAALAESSRDNLGCRFMAVDAHGPSPLGLSFPGCIQCFTDKMMTENNCCNAEVSLLRMLYEIEFTYNPHSTATYDADWCSTTFGVLWCVMANFCTDAVWHLFRLIWWTMNPIEMFQHVLQTLTGRIRQATSKSFNTAKNHMQ